MRSKFLVYCKTFNICNIKFRGFNDNGIFAEFNFGVHKHRSPQVIYKM